MKSPIDQRMAYYQRLVVVVVVVVVVVGMVFQLLQLDMQANPDPQQITDMREAAKSAFTQTTGISTTASISPVRG